MVNFVTLDFKLSNLSSSNLKLFNLERYELLYSLFKSIVFKILEKVENELMAD